MFWKTSLQIRKFSSNLYFKLHTNKLRVEVINFCVKSYINTYSLEFISDKILNIYNDQLKIVVAFNGQSHYRREVFCELIVIITIFLKSGQVVTIFKAVPSTLCLFIRINSCVWKLQNKKSFILYLLELYSIQFIRLRTLALQKWKIN